MCIPPEIELVTLDKAFEIEIDGLVKSRHPVEKRGPGVFKCLRTLDSGFRRNDGKNAFSTFFLRVHQKLVPKTLSYKPERQKSYSAAGLDILRPEEKDFFIYFMCL
jgi:hypothetical protein